MYFCHCNCDCTTLLFVLGRIKTLFSVSGKITSLVTKKDYSLATKIEEAIKKNENLEAITKESVRMDVTRNQITEQRRKNKNVVKPSKVRDKSDSRISSTNTRSGIKDKSDSRSRSENTRSGTRDKSDSRSRSENTRSGARDKSDSRSRTENARSGTKPGKQSTPSKFTKKGFTVSKSVKSSSTSSFKKTSSDNKRTGKKTTASKSTRSKLSVVGFRGRNASSSDKRQTF